MKHQPGQPQRSAVFKYIDQQVAKDMVGFYEAFGMKAPEPALPTSPITEEMHQAACKVLCRASGLDGTPQRMLDAMRSVAPEQAVQGPLHTTDTTAVLKQALGALEDPYTWDMEAAITAIKKHLGL